MSLVLVEDCLILGGARSVFEGVAVVVVSCICNEASMASASRLAMVDEELGTEGSGRQSGIFVRGTGVVKRLRF